MLIRCLIVAALIAALPSISAAATSDPLDKQGIGELQECLNKKGFNAGVADGIAGKQTVKAVRKFKAAAIAAQGKTGQIEVTDEINKSVLIGCTFYEKKNAQAFASGEVEAEFYGQNATLKWRVTENNSMMESSKVELIIDVPNMKRGQQLTTNVAYLEFLCGEGNTQKVRLPSSYRVLGNDRSKLKANFARVCEFDDFVKDLTVVKK